MTRCVKLLEVKYNACILFFTHWMPFVCNTTMQQHFNHNHHKNFTTRKGKNKKNLPEPDILLSNELTLFFSFFLSFLLCFELAKAWRVGKSRCTVWQETKTESFHARENWYPKLFSCLVLSFHSEWENFISCLFHKLSRQEKHFFLLHEFSIG